MDPFAQQAYDEEMIQLLDERGYNAQYVIEKDTEIDLTHDDPIIDGLPNFNENETQTWIDSARELYGRFAPKPAPMRSRRGGKMVFTEKPDPDASNLSDEEVAQWGLELMGSYNYRPEEWLTYFDNVDKMSPREKVAFYNLLTSYDKLPDGTWSGTGRMLRYTLTSPSTYVGLSTLGAGFLARQAFKRAGKKGVLDYMKKLMPAAIATGIETGAYTGLDDAMRQISAMEAGAQEEFDPLRTGAAAGVGTVAGTGLGLAIPGAADAVGKALGAGVRMAGGGKTIGMGVGPVPQTPAPGSYNDLRNKPDALGFRSGVYNMLDDLPNAASGDQILATLSDPQRLGKYGAKAEELDLLGLPGFLKGKDRVTKEELKDYIEQNRVELDYKVNEGIGGYAFASEPIDLDEMPLDFDDLLSNRYSGNEFEFERQVVTGFAGEDPSGLEMSIVKTFPVNGQTIDRLLDEVELITDNDINFWVGPEDVGFDPEYAVRVTGAPDGLYRNPEIQKAIDEARSINNAGTTNPNLMETVPSATRRAQLIEQLKTLDDLVDGEVFRAMDDLTTFKLYDENGVYRGETFSYDDAVHRSNAYVESADEFGEASTQYEGVTFPSNGLENYKEFRLLMPEADQRFPGLRNVSQHFEDNTFSHFRSSDRVLLNREGASVKGKFVEELQSDAAQSALKRGVFKGTNEQRIAAGEEYRAAETKVSDYASDNTLDPLAQEIARMSPDTFGGYQNNRFKKHLIGKIIRGAIDGKANGIPAEYFEPNFIEKLTEPTDDLNEISRTILRNFVRFDPLEGFDTNDVTSIKNALFATLKGLSSEQRESFIDLANKYELANAASKGVTDFPMRKNWLEVTMKAAISDAIEDGHSVIAFPNSRQTIAEIEGYGDVRDDAITRTYEKDIPKILKKLARQYDGVIEEGVLEDAANKQTRIDGSGSVIMLKLNDPGKVRGKGVALPSVIAGGSGAATSLATQNDEQSRLNKTN